MKHNSRNTKWLIAACLLTITMFTACSTDAELCDATEHPHVGKVNYAFNWGSYADVYEQKTGIPDSMYIIGTRVVNHWKTAMVVSSAVGKPNRGYFVFNAPDYLTQPDTPQDPPQEEKPDTPQEPTNPENPDNTGHNGGNGTNAPAKHDNDTRADGDDTENPEDRPDYKPALTHIGSEMSDFSIRTGSYKFVTFNMDTTKFVYNKVVEYMLDPTSEKKLQDMYVDYKTYDKGSDELDYDGMKDWQDYNGYSNYMQPNVTPIFIDTMASRNIEKGKVTIEFHPAPMTQNIDIYFNIKKDNKNNTHPFIIEDVRAELSGIPTRIYFANGNMDIRETAKMMFRTKICDPATGQERPDLYSSNMVRCHGNIDVTTVVQSHDSNVTTGPGILQVIIYTRAETGEIKKIQGKINLYNTLRNSNLIHYTEDGNFAVRNGNKGVIDIVADVTIDGEAVVLDNDNTGGLDKWQPCTKFEIDI